MSEQIRFVLERVPADAPHMRPYAMEALIREGATSETVFSEFAASDPERLQVADLLARRPVSEGVW